MTLLTLCFPDTLVQGYLISLTKDPKTQVSLHAAYPNLLHVNSLAGEGFMDIQYISHLQLNNNLNLILIQLIKEIQLQESIAASFIIFEVPVYIPPWSLGSGYNTQKVRIQTAGC